VIFRELDIAAHDSKQAWMPREPVRTVKQVEQVVRLPA
jgi:hypothetical protein